MRNGNSLRLLINENKVFSFAEILSTILETKYNHQIIRYSESQIKLNENWSYVSQVILIPLDDSQKVETTKLDLKNTNSVPLPLPQDVIYVVVGDQLSWGRTNSKVTTATSIDSIINE